MGATAAAGEACLGLLDDESLFARHALGDIPARDVLVERYLPRAKRAALRYNRRHEPLDDLEQVACMALFKAIGRYEPGRGASFWSFALPTIIGELKRHFRDHCWTIRVPRATQECVLNVQRTTTRLSTSLGRSPSPGEIAAELGITSEDVVEAIEAASAYGPGSLDAPLAGEEDGGATYADVLGADDARFDTVEGLASIAPALRALPERERMILHLRFVEDLTQSEIAEQMGISQMHVSRLIRRALTTVRDQVGVSDGRREPASAAASSGP